MKLLARQIVGADEEPPKIVSSKKKSKKKRRKVSQQSQGDMKEVLEGEFDSATARKIRNFFSRDADYTRFRILELVEEEDDVLIETLLELLLIETALRRSNSRLAIRLRYVLDPFLLFHDFLDCTDADYQFLLQLLLEPPVNGRTLFLEYLLRFCKRMSANWNPCKTKPREVNRVMSVLIRLRMHIQNLYERGSFHYFSPKALLRAMGNVEFCYEGEKIEGGENNEGKEEQAGFDLDYINYIKKKKEQKLEAEKAEREKKETKKKAKPKKMKVSSLFLADVQQRKEEKLRNSQIETNREKILAKRKKKRSTRTLTKRKGDDEEVMLGVPNKPMMMRNESVAAHIMESKCKSKKKRKRNRVKQKVDLASLKKIDFRKKLGQARVSSHQVVDADKKVRIGF